MKITLKEISDINQSLLRFLSKEIDVKLAYRMRKISGRLVAEMKHIEKSISDIREKHGEKEKKDGQETGDINIPLKNMAAFKKDVDDLLALEIDISGEKIPFECLESAGKISGLDMANIEKFIEEPKKEKK